MCGIGAIVDLDHRPVERLEARLDLINRLLMHRGPDGEGMWMHPRSHAGFAHRRLQIIDLATGDQPMTDGHGNWLTYNGEIYNYKELRRELGEGRFRTTSDTEVVLEAYREWGPRCVERLRGMFAFALWDERESRLFCARDPVGIKPLYHAVVDGVFYCASEPKALLPFLARIETDMEALKDYLAFQFTLGPKTLFRGIESLLPGHTLTVQNGAIRTQRYWEVHFEPDFDHTEGWFTERLEAALDASIDLHLRADVPVGAYLSGGLDSTITASLAAERADEPLHAFTGRFASGDRYDETRYAREAARAAGFELHETTITSDDFVRTIESVVYHLDYPVAGPGSFPQYMVSELAAQHRKVVLGGQGGDEIFGGYARYLLAYFEQCIKAAIDGTMHNGNFVVTYESIIPQLGTLREYKPLMQEFWRDGLFGDLAERYFRLVNRAPSLDDAIEWKALGDYSPYESFLTYFRADNVRKESYFDLMTHFDFKTLLPALLHVEDRVSMAHGLESRVPFVDVEVIELAATFPADVKFKDGQLKHALKQSVGHVVPPLIRERRDKMGFPVPLGEWVKNDLRDFVHDVFARSDDRPYLSPSFDANALAAAEGQFGRNLWGLLSLELWHQQFHDRSAYWRGLVHETAGREAARVRPGEVLGAPAAPYE